MANPGEPFLDTVGGWPLDSGSGEDEDSSSDAGNDNILDGEIQRLQEAKMLASSDPVQPTSKKRKRQSDDDAPKPKRRKTAYQCYAKDARLQVQTKHPDMPSREVTKVVAQQWSALPREEKKLFEDMAAKESEGWQKPQSVSGNRFPAVSNGNGSSASLPLLNVPLGMPLPENILDSLDDEEEDEDDDGSVSSAPGHYGGYPSTQQSQHPPLSQSPTEAPKKRGRKPKVKKWSKDPNAPKRALSAYMHYLLEVREEVTAQLRQTSVEKPRVAEVTRTVSARWQALSPEQRAVYQERSKEDRARYEKEKLLYTEKKEDKKPQDYKPASPNHQSLPSVTSHSLGPYSPMPLSLSPFGYGLDSTDYVTNSILQPTSITLQSPIPSLAPAPVPAPPPAPAQAKGFPQRERKTRNLKFRVVGETQFHDITLQQFTYNKLCKRIQEKRKDHRPIQLVVLLNTGVEVKEKKVIDRLQEDAELEVTFSTEIPEPQPQPLPKQQVRAPAGAPPRYNPPINPTQRHHIPPPNTVAPLPADFPAARDFASF